MKKNIRIVTYIAVAAMFSLASCNSSKKAIKTGEKQEIPVGEVEIKIPCSGSEFFSDKKNFRANAVGESLDQMTSKKKARVNAKTELAGAINSTIKSVIDNYVNSREVNNVEEVSEKFEGLSREVVNQELSGVRTICEKLVMTADGKYKTYLAIELAGDDLVESINERLSKEEQLKVDYDYQKFKESFEAEMSKME